LRQVAGVCQELEAGEWDGGGVGAADPVAGALRVPPQRLAQLQHDLAAIISAEALFSLTDLCRLAPDDAVRSLVRTASTITAAATRGDSTGPSQPGKRRSHR